MQKKDNKISLDECFKKKISWLNSCLKKWQTFKIHNCLHLRYSEFCPSWIWVLFSFAMLVEFSAIIFSNKFSAPFSLFSTPGTPVI